ncbi:MAG: Hint domain-containing protein [Acetobacteraceae bacterium]
MTKLTWVAVNPGTWTSPGNWSPAQMPGAADDVVFDGSGNALSFVSSTSIHTLTIADPTTLLSATGTLTVAEDLMISAGTLSVASTGRAVLKDFSNQGTIRVASGGTVSASGSYDTDSVSRIGGSGGTLRLLGTLANTGNVWTLPGTAAVNITALGTVVGGTVVGNHTAIYGEPATLDGVTWRGNLGVEGTLQVNSGLVVRNADGTGDGTLTVAGGTVQFNGTQTFDNVDVRLMAQYAAHNFIMADGSLTLGAGTRILLDDTGGRGGELIIKLDGVDAASTIVNQGTVAYTPNGSASDTGGIFVWVANFRNEGVLSVSGAASLVTYSLLRVTSTAFTNAAGGTITVEKGAGTTVAEMTVSSATDFTNDGLISVNGGSLDVAPLLQGSGQVLVQQHGTADLHLGATQGQTIAFGDSGVLELGLPALFAGTITGVTSATRIDLGVSATALSYTANQLLMQLDGGQTFTLTIVGDGLTLDDFIVNTGTATTSITTDVPAPCFAAGTRIETMNGAVAVEALRVGDRVRVASDAGWRDIIWIGHRRVDCRLHPRPKQVLPVRVAAGAFGAGRPSRDLYLSPDHAVFVDGVLIPVRCLVNGDSIAQCAVNEVTYFHVELACHDIVLAEGLSVESYLDTGDRDSFANGGGVTRLFPAFGPAGGSGMVWDAHACAPLVVTGPKVEAVRRVLAQASAARGSGTAARGRRSPSPGQRRTRAG